MVARCAACRAAARRRVPDGGSVPRSERRCVAPDVDVAGARAAVLLPGVSVGAGVCGRGRRVGRGCVRTPASRAEGASAAPSSGRSPRVRLLSVRRREPGPARGCEPRQAPRVGAWRAGRPFVGFVADRCCGCRQLSRPGAEAGTLLGPARACERRTGSCHKNQFRCARGSHARKQNHATHAAQSHRGRSPLRDATLGQAAQRRSAALARSGQDGVERRVRAGARDQRAGRARQVLCGGAGAGDAVEASGLCNTPGTARKGPSSSSLTGRLPESACPGCPR